MNTYRIVVRQKCGVDYVYHGLLNGIRRISFENQAIIPAQKFNLIVNVGGVLLYNQLVLYSGHFFPFSKVISFNFSGILR